MKENGGNVVIVSDILSANSPVSDVEEFENHVVKSFPLFSNYQFDFFHRNIHENLDKIKMPTTAFFLESTDHDFSKTKNLTVAITKSKQISGINTLEEELKKITLKKRNSDSSVTGEKEEFTQKWEARLF